MNDQEYINGKKQVSLDEFLSFEPIDAISFDFLSQGEEADRTKLINEIYHKIFPWYDENSHAGDTLNTYRTAIKKFYGKYYPALDKSTQKEILEIIKENTFSDEDMIFELDYISDSGNPCKKICNNYQLGNFGIFPKLGGINPLRAKVPYNDYFDNILALLRKFYDDELDSETELEKAIHKNSDYFNQFSDIDDFIDKNYLIDFLGRDSEENVGILGLSEAQDFEQYVEAVTSIIDKRGCRIYKVLHDLEPNDGEPLDILDLEDDKSDNVEEIKKDTTISYLTSLEKTLSKLDVIEESYQQEIEPLAQKYNEIKDNFSIKLIIFSILSFFPLIIASSIIGMIFPFGQDIIFILCALLSLGGWGFALYAIISNIKNSAKRKIAKSSYNKMEKESRKKAELKIQKFYDSDEYKKYKYEFPNEFLNQKDVRRLKKLLYERVDNLQQAFSVLEQQKHNEAVQRAEADRVYAENQRRLLAEQQLDEQRRQQRETNNQLQELNKKLEEQNKKLEERNKGRY